MEKDYDAIYEDIFSNRAFDAGPGNELIHATISRILKQRVRQIASLNDQSVSMVVNFLLNVGVTQYETELIKSAEDQADLEYKAKMAAAYDELADILYKNSEVVDDDEIPF